MNRLKVRLNAKIRFDRWLRDYPRATPIAVFCIGLALVALAGWSVEIAQKRSRVANWQAEASDIAAAIEQQSASDAAYLEATSALFASVDDLSPELFHNFVDRLQSIYELNGVTGIGWLERLAPRDLAALRDRLAEQGLVVRSLAPQTQTQAGGTSHAVIMLEPETPANRSMIGLDLYGEPVRRAAIEKAERSDAIAATDIVSLGEPGAGEADRGIIVFAPVRALEAQRRFRGLVFMTIGTAEFVRAAIGPELLARGRIELTRSAEDGAVREIFASEPDARRFEAPLQEEVKIFDQEWTLHFSPSPRESSFPLSFFVLFSGAAFSLLLLAYILLVQRRSLDLQELVDAQIAREKERAAFVRELNHRVNNSLANVTSLISLTRRRATDVQSFADTLLKRVRALASSHALLESGQWGPTDLGSLIRAQFGSSDLTDERIHLEGPDVVISPNDALAAGLALHELATNATRHGALTRDEGRVTVSWHVVEDKWVEVDWQESGGPEVTPPTERGFGLNLIERALAHELGRPIIIAFNPEGLHCQMQIVIREPTPDFQIKGKGQPAN